jgi:D-glycerate 3-kinase
MIDSHPGHDWVVELGAAESLPETYAASVLEHVAPLAARIDSLYVRAARPVVVGISGAQGSGKSTLALFLANWLARELDRSVVRLSLDDFYFGKALRATIARTVHPLLATRGVPGTHDVELLSRTLAALTDSSGHETVTLPAFDKATDDRMPLSSGRRVAAPVDVVLLEGWCVGARPQDSEALAEPVNALEASADPTGAWRRFVNERLRKEYAALFDRLDALILLRVASFERVLEWRRLQEEKMLERLRREAPRGAAPSGQTPEELAVFVMHFERLTRHMLATMPGYADTVIDIDDEHRMVASSHPGW